MFSLRFSFNKWFIEILVTSFQINLTAIKRVVDVVFADAEGGGSVFALYCRSNQVHLSHVPTRAGTSLNFSSPSLQKVTRVSMASLLIASCLTSSL